MPKASALADPPAIPSLRLKQLVEQVLQRLPQPHTERVIEDVFLAIEGEPGWRSTYDRVVYESGKAVANSWASYWIAHAVKRMGDQRETASRATLIQSFLLLVTPVAKRNKKMTQPEALRAMHEHFVANRASLPEGIRDYREMILALMMDGVSTESAFAQALDRPSLAW